MSQAICVPSLDGFLFTWADLPFEVALKRIRESSRGTSGEIEVKYLNGSATAKTLTHQGFNLLTSKTRLAKELNDKQEAPWLAMLEQVSVLSLRHLRAGEPVESLQPTESDHSAWYVLNPLLFDKNPTIIYGPGNSLKSFFVLYCGLLLASGKCGPNLSVAEEPWRVLFLDYEMSVQDVRGRVKMLQHGDKRLKGVPDYRRCYQALADEVADLKKVVTEGQYDILIIDSLAMAAGGMELERADSAIRFNGALRSLNCTSLIVGHTPKPQEGQKERSLYGSVFFNNLGRNSWEVRREGSLIGLYHNKHNLSAKHPDLGFNIDIDGETCAITEGNLADDPVLSTNLPLQERLATELTTRPGQTIKELALSLCEKQTSLRAKLNSYKKRFIAVDGKWECLG